MGFAAAADLHTGGLDEFPKHLGGGEGGDLTAPIVMAEQGIGLNIAAQLGEAVDQFIHFVRIFIEGRQAFLHGQQVVALLKMPGA